MPWRLIPLHSQTDGPVALPLEGAASIGRRPANEIVINNLAVSGQHCIVHCRRGGSADGPTVEDCSTNGTYVNDTKLGKAQQHQLVIGDVLSLTKPPEDDAGPLRIQFRLEFVDEAAPMVKNAAIVAPILDRRAPPAPTHLTGGDIMLTAPDPRAPLGGGTDLSKLGHDPLGTCGGAADNNFAQDLLVQEQQSKAKITGELLIVQRKLEEERQASESINRELRKLRHQLDEERAKRQEAEECRDRLTSEAEVLRSERRQLQDLTASHEELQGRHVSAEGELQNRLRRCAQLEASVEQLRHDVERATESHQKASQQHAELNTRARQAQERADRLEAQNSEIRREGDRALDEGSRLQRELATEVQAREKIEEQVRECKEQLVSAEAGERSARDALDAATARRAELECNASSAQSDAEAAKAAARQSQQRLSAILRQAEVLRETGKSLSTELHRRAALWDKALSEGKFDGLSEALALHDAPTFEAVTCLNDAGTPTRSQNDDQEDEGRTAPREEAAPQPNSFAQGAAAADATAAAAAATASTAAPGVGACGKPEEAEHVAPQTVPAASACAATVAAAVGDPMLGGAAALGPAIATAAAAMDTVAGMDFDHLGPGSRGPLQTEPPLPPPVGAASNGSGGVGVPGPLLTPAPGILPQDAALAPEPAATALCFEDGDSHEAHEERSSAAAHGALAGGAHIGHIDDDGLLEAVAREPPSATGSAAAGATAVGGCSTAWSLELLDVVESRQAMQDDRPPKRARRPDM